MMMTGTERVVEYLRQCGVFYVATENGVFPRVRPMRHVCFHDGAVYFLIDKNNEMYSELLLNNRAEICATHPSHSVLTLSCTLEEESSGAGKEAVLAFCRASLDGICASQRLTAFRLMTGKALLVDYDKKKEEWAL